MPSPSTGAIPKKRVNPKPVAPEQEKISPKVDPEVVPTEISDPFIPCVDLCEFMKIE